MSTYSLRLAHVVGSYDETPMVMIDAVITDDEGRFVEGALPFEATARDAATTVRSFMALLSPNGKALHAYFTTDAFNAFPGSIDLDFGHVGHVMGTITNVDPSTVAPLAPAYAALNLPNADTAWLATL